MTPPAEGSLLDRRTLNRTLLARQHLLRRVAMPLPDMIDHLVGLQAQVPRDPYVSLWSRVDRFDPAELERLLLERAAVRMTLMRTTLHLVTARDAPGLRAAMQPVCERRFGSSPFRARLEGVDLAELCRAGAAAVEERPRSTAELGRILAERWPGVDRDSLASAVRYLVPVVQVTPRGLLRRSSAPKVTTLAAWLGHEGEALLPGNAPVPGNAPAPGNVPAPGNAEAAGTLAADDVVYRYLRAFGPASAADIRSWSGLAQVRDVIARLRPRLRAYRDEAGREVLDVVDGVFAAAEEPAPVRFTGEYDNLFLAHADRTRITGDSAWGLSYTRRGAFFVDGFLAGAWRLRQTGDRASLEIEPRIGIAPPARLDVEAEAEALLGLLAPESRTQELHWLPG